MLMYQWKNSLKIILFCLKLRHHVIIGKSYRISEIEKISKESVQELVAGSSWHQGTEVGG